VSPRALRKGTTGKRLAIVFVETGEADGHGFQVFLEGAAGVKWKREEDLTAAEFWAVKCFAIVVDLLQHTGAAVSSEKPT